MSIRAGRVTAEYFKVVPHPWTLVLKTLCIFSKIKVFAQSRMDPIKGTNVLTTDFSVLPCLLQIYNRLHLQDYRKFWNTERWKSFD